MGDTESLAEFIVNLTFKNIPENVIHQAKKCFLDWLGVALGGKNYPIAEILTEFAVDIGGKEQATIFGKGIRTNILNAALANGAISHVLDFDDTHIDSLCHVSSPIMPVIFSLGEYKHINGKDCIAAFVSAFEASASIGIAIMPDHYHAGWHATSTLGHLGATAAAGKLLGLNQEEMRHALGIGATQAGGFQVVFGTMCKPFHPGKAAMDGILAAMLAKKGFDSHKDILEEKKGFCEMFSRDVDYRKMTEGLGKKYQILNNTFKPYASCLLTHPSIDAALDLRNTYNISIQDIEKVEAHVAPLVMDIAGKKNPKTALEGKFSVNYCIGVALAEGEVGEDKFTDQRMYDETLSNLQKLISIEVDPEFDNTTAELTLKTRKGSSYTQKILTPRGDPRNPLSFSQLEKKFKILARMVLPEEKVEGLITHFQKLEKLEDMNRIIQLCY